MTTCRIIIRQERRRIIECQIETDNAAEMATEQRGELRVRIQQVIIITPCACAMV